MGMFARESGPTEAPTIVFLHGAKHCGESWQPVVKRLSQYHCLLPDLPRHGESVHEGPFSIDGAAAAVAQLIRSRAGTDRVHLVGHSLGAQVGAQLLATEPDLIDRAVLCGILVNPLPAVWLTRRLLGAYAGISRSIAISQALQEGAGTDVNDRPEDTQLLAPEQVAEIVEASAGFTIPAGFEKSPSPTLFLTGSTELPFVHSSAGILRWRMPHGANAIMRGMGHDWPLRFPGVFARTVEGWLFGTALPHRLEFLESVQFRATQVETRIGPSVAR